MKMTMTIRKMIFGLLLLPLFLAGCAQTSSVPVRSAMGKDGYVLDSGDTLRLIVYGQEELSGEFTIDPSGRISVPLIKDITASGMTVTQLEDAITARLQPKYLKDPRVSVEVLEYRSVYILGEVRTPGKYAYVPNMTILQAVAMAGGHTYRASENKAKVTRLENDLLKTYTVDTNTMVRPGDTIVIGRRWF